MIIDTAKIEIFLDLNLNNIYYQIIEEKTGITKNIVKDIRNNVTDIMQLDLYTALKLNRSWEIYVNNDYEKLKLFIIT